MNGFHSGYDPKSVKMAHTRAADAPIVVSDRIIALTETVPSYEELIP